MAADGRSCNSVGMWGCETTVIRCNKMKQDVTKIQIVFLMLAALVNLCNT